MDDAVRAKKMAQLFFLEAAKERDGNQARLFVCVAKIWVDVLSSIERRTVTAQEVVGELSNTLRAEGQGTAAELVEIRVA